MESFKKLEKSDAILKASTQGEAFTADPDTSNAANGLLAYTPNTTGLDSSTLGDLDRPQTPLDTEFESAAFCPTAIQAGSNKSR